MHFDLENKTDSTYRCFLEVILPLLADADLDKF